MSTYPVFTNKKGRTLVFYPVPKNANTSAKYFLVKHLGKVDEYRKPFDLNNQFEIHIDNLSKPKVTDLLPSKQKFDTCKADEKAVILREPIDRFKSAYANKVVFKNKSYKNHSVEQVIEKLEQGKFEDKHFLPQTYFIGEDLNYFTIIATTQDLKPFEDGLNKFFDKTIQFPKVRSGSSQIEVEITSSQKDRLYNIYKKDLELYNDYNS